MLNKQSKPARQARGAKEVSVVVVGGGLSGLSAAEHILRSSQRKHKVMVLEAMDRVGGRTLSHNIHGAVFDLGGMWVGRHQKHVHALARRANLRLIKQHMEGLNIFDVDGKVERYSQDVSSSISLLGRLLMKYYVSKLNRMAQQVPLDQPVNCPHGIEWDSMTVESWIQRNVWLKSVRKLIEGIVRIVFGVEPSEMSFLYFLWFARQSGSITNIVDVKVGNQEEKFASGADSLSFFLYDQIQKLGGEVVRDCMVKSIKRHRNGKYTVQTVHPDYPSIRCQHIIMAMPPVSVGRIEFTPPLSKQRDMICGKNFMGSIIKVLLLYERRFWAENGFSAEILASSLDHPVFNTYDDSRPKANGQLQPAIAVFVMSAFSRTWGCRQDIIDKTIEKIKEYFGEGTPNPIETYIYNWDDNPFVRGGPVGVFGTGLLSQVRELKTQQGNIHWAGTQVAHQGMGFMDGAIQSGIRAAQEVIEQMEHTGKKSTPKEDQLKQIPVSWYYQLFESHSWMNYFF